MAGNAAVVALLREGDAIPVARQRESGHHQEDSPESSGVDETDWHEDTGLTPEEGRLFEQLMLELSDEQLTAAFEELAAELTAHLEGDEAAHEAGEVSVAPTATGPEWQQSSQEAAVSRTVTVQRGKKKGDGGLSSAATPNLKLAGRLEKNKSRKPRLVTTTRWRQILKKQAKKNPGYRKYAAILHQNLQADLTTDDLVLLIRLHKLAKIGGKREQHYKAIEAKSKQKSKTSGGQSAQIRTELLGETVAALRMETYTKGNGKLLIGYSSGAGIDQLWVDNSKKVYYVVEAKGPGAQVTVAKFAVRGAAPGGGQLVQMSAAWVADRIPRLKTTYPNELRQLLRDCALVVDKQGRLKKDPAPGKVATHTLQGLVITASWSDANADVGSSMSKRLYNF